MLEIYELIYPMLEYRVLYDHIHLFVHDNSKSENMRIHDLVLLNERLSQRLEALPLDSIICRFFFEQVSMRIVVVT